MNEAEMHKQDVERVIQEHITEFASIAVRCLDAKDRTFKPPAYMMAEAYLMGVQSEKERVK